MTGRIDRELNLSRNAAASKDQNIVLTKFIKLPTRSEQTNFVQFDETTENS